MLHICTRKMYCEGRWTYLVAGADPYFSLSVRQPSGFRIIVEDVEECVRLRHESLCAEDVSVVLHRTWAPENEFPDMLQTDRKEVESEASARRKKFVTAVWIRDTCRWSRRWTAPVSWSRDLWWLDPCQILRINRTGDYAGYDWLKFHWGRKGYVLFSMCLSCTSSW